MENRRGEAGLALVPEAEAFLKRGRGLRKKRGKILKSTALGLADTWFLLLAERTVALFEQPVDLGEVIV